MKQKIIILLALVLALACCTGCSAASRVQDWNDLTLSEALPAPASKRMTVYNNDRQWLNVWVQDMTADDFSAYVTACKSAANYTVDPEKQDDSFTAATPEGYTVYLYYFTGTREMSISLIAPPYPIPTPTPQPTPVQPTPVPTPAAEVTGLLTLESTAADPQQNGDRALPGFAENTGNTMVWIPTRGGVCYHTDQDCSNMIEPILVTVRAAIANGFTPCSKCYG